MILPKLVDGTLPWPRKLQENCKTLETSNPTLVFIRFLHFSFKSALFLKFIAETTF